MITLRCQSCEQLRSIPEEIMGIVERSAFMKDSEGTQVADEQKKHRLFYLIDTATDGITEWQKHIMRSINQEKPKLEFMRNLDMNTVIIIGDFAMKMLPFSGRMSQKDWFGLKGKRPNHNIFLVEALCKQRLHSPFCKKNPDLTAPNCILNPMIRPRRNLP